MANFATFKASYMEYNEILEKQIIGRLRVDNPWWAEGNIPPFYGSMRPRLYLDIFHPLVISTDIRRAFREGADVSRMLPPAVEAFIRRRGLYGARPSCFS